MTPPTMAMITEPMALMMPMRQAPMEWKTPVICFLLVYCKWSVYGMYMECMLGGMGIGWCRRTQDTTAPILGFVCVLRSI